MLAQFCEQGCQANRAACFPLVALQSRLFADARILHVVVTTHRCAIQQKARRPPMPEAFQVDRTILRLAYFLAAQYSLPHEGGDDFLEPDTPRPAGSARPRAILPRGRR